ncbi:MAG: hypothetical protein ABI771_04330 [Betaproteobacteria bacterium]
MNMQNKLDHQPRWSTRLMTAGAAVVVGFALAGPVFADEMSHAAKGEADIKYDQTVHQAKLDYKAARAKCNELGGNAKDVCVKEAKSAETATIADAKAAKKSTDTGAAAGADKREAEFKVAREKCDSMSGNTKDICKKEAEAQYHQ